MALCAQSRPANKDTMERENNIVLAGTEKIMRAIMGVRAFDSLPNYAYVRGYTV
jgi:hypothetical protein